MANGLLYSTLKPKIQNCYRLRSYDDILLGTLMSQLVYKNFPEDEDINTNFLEMYKLTEGHAAIFKGKDNKYVVGHCSFSGSPDANGIGKNVLVATDNGFTKEFIDWKNNTDVAVFFNNNLYSPDLSIGIFSDLLAENDKSLSLLMKYSRLLPIPVAKDNDQKKAIDELLNVILEADKPKAIVSKELLSDIINDNNGSAIEILNISDVNNSDKIQYISKLRDDIFRWFYSLNGMNSSGSSKMAQMTTDEVNQDSNASMIIPDIRLRVALENVETMNKKFGWNVEVSLSECWMNRKATLDEEFAETDEELEDSVDTVEDDQENQEPSAEPVDEPEDKSDEKEGKEDED